VATPNNTHYEISKAALTAGLHVICEKPLCFKTDEAEELATLAAEKKLVYGVTYGYTGYQMIRQARKMVAAGDLGKIRLVNMQFASGGFNTGKIEADNNFARWRLDPAISGPSFIIGDVGTHTLFLSETIAPQLEIEKLLCTKQSFVETRELEDNAYVLLQYKGGAAGMLWVSAVNSGSVHGQKVRIVGEKASIEWWDEHPNQLRYEIEGEPLRILDRGSGFCTPARWKRIAFRAGIRRGYLNPGRTYTAATPLPWMPPSEKITIFSRTIGIPMFGPAHGGCGL
jgi:predicted dehydrogenase